MDIEKINELRGKSGLKPLTRFEANRALDKRRVEKTLGRAPGFDSDDDILLFLASVLSADDVPQAPPTEHMAHTEAPAAADDSPAPSYGGNDSPSGNSDSGASSDSGGGDSGGSTD